MQSLMRDHSSARRWRGVRASLCSGWVVEREIEERDMMFFFFFNDTATTEIYTLSLHDALPISAHASIPRPPPS